MSKDLENFDSELFNAIKHEKRRQFEHIELIASENYTSKNVMDVQGSILTNKYAEGYPEKRYYGGCEYVDVVEQLAIDRAKELFGAGYANVQPHSGSQANAAVFQALIQPNDLVMGMKLDHGGHLTHGSSVNFSGKTYRSVGYGVNEDGEIDYDEIAMLAKEHNPKLIIAGFSAYSGILDFSFFRKVADSCGAYLLVDMAHVAGLVAAGLYPNPVEFADVVTSTTHKTLRGPRGGIILSNNPDLYKKLNSAIFPGIQGGPLMHVIGGKAVAFKEALSPDFVDYQRNVLLNAVALSERLKDHGFKIVSNGTKNHLILVDLTTKNINGKEAEALLGRINITVNKNSIPNDKQSPFVTSGIRIGTPAITTRGFNTNDCVKIGNVINSIINDRSEKNIQKQKKIVLNLTKDKKIDF
jgi:glycine hydroxymethyltransferase